jgi:hypothetical protein
MGDLMEQNKTYLGYRPKDNNITKLAQYLRAKGALPAQKSAVNNKFTNLASNKILRNKRF